MQSDEGPKLFSRCDLICFDPGPVSQSTLLPLFYHHWFGSKWLAVVGARDVKSLTQGDDDEGLQAGWDSGLGQ